MPQRKPPELLTKHYTYPRPHSITKPVTWWEKKARERAAIDAWNEQASEFRKELVEHFAIEHKVAVVATLQRFGTLVDGLNFEKCKPRNYLSYEKIYVRHLKGEFLYYFGRYDNLEQLMEHIELEILNYAGSRADQ